ncbi:MAG TPA: hypothetical protein VKZ49_16240 [Polyangiaceae bacterium]|nr:hypothetical protein [Polyangiaceae bacterium]
MATLAPSAVRGLTLAIAACFVVACAGSDDGDGNSQPKAGGSSVEKVCDRILDQCGAGANGFTRSECLELGSDISIDCMDCILEAGCDYEAQCHDPANRCELK